MLLLLLACTGADVETPSETPAEVEPPSETPAETPAGTPAEAPEAPPGVALVQVEGKGLVLIDGEGAQRIDSSPLVVDTLAVAPDGAVWLSARGELRRAPSASEAFEVLPVSGGPGRLVDMAFGPDGALYAISQDKLGVFTDGAWSQVALPDGAQMLEDVAVSAAGDVFITGYHVLFHRSGEAWTTERFEDLIPGLEFFDELVFGPDGALYSIYVGGDSHGLLRYAEGEWSTFPDAARFSGTAQGLGFTPAGVRLTTNYDGGFERGEGGDAVTLKKADLGYEAYEVTAFAADARERIWVGTDRGLVLIDGDAATQWSPGTVPELDGKIERILVTEGGPPPPGVVNAVGQVKGRLLREGAPLAGHEVALCDKTSMMHMVHPCEAASLSLESQTDAEGRFLFDEVPFGGMTFIYREADEDWVIVLGAACCKGIRPGEVQDLGDLDLRGEG